MPIFQCPICGQKFESVNYPISCPHDGSENVEFELITDGLSKFFLVNDSNKMLIYKKMEIGRKELKSFFPSLYDEDGNNIYMYCDKLNPMLVFELNSDGVFEVSSPHKVKNYFLFNGSKLNNEKQIVKNGNKFSLFSTSKKTIVTEFEVKL